MNYHRRTQAEMLHVNAPYRDDGKAEHNCQIIVAPRLVSTSRPTGGSCSCLNPDLAWQYRVSKSDRLFRGSEIDWKWTHHC
jgi:hypothetical protein